MSSFSEPCGERVFGIAPIERLELPAELDGRGDRRRRQCRLPVQTDLGALALWLDTGSDDPTTRTLYQHHVEKCLLWAVIERCKPLSWLNGEDAKAFDRFMSNPHPWGRWVRGAATARNSPQWRPFRGGLSASSRHQVITILSLFFSWMASHNYVREDPWFHAFHGISLDNRRERAPITVGGFHHCMVTLPEWDYLCKVLDQLPNDEGGLRQKLMFSLAYYADLKPGEIAQATIGAIHIPPMSLHAVPTIWKFDVAGRTELRTPIVLLPPVVDFLGRYLTCRGIAWSDIHTAADTTLIAPIRRDRTSQKGRTLSSVRGSIYQMGKGVFKRAADLAKDDGNAMSSERLMRASLGWLTHAFENHCEQRDFRTDALWYLLGAKSLLSETMLQYCKDRVGLSAAELHKYMEKVQPMWRRDR